MATHNKYFKKILSSIPIFSTHQHHLEEQTHRELNLTKVFQHSYVSWCSMPANDSWEARDEWLDGIRTNSYFVWLEKSIMKIYQTDHITADNWDDISRKITDAHQTPSYHLNVLKEQANFIGFLEDCYWNTGSDIGYPEFITPVYRIDMWIQGFHPDSADQDGNSPFDLEAEKITNFDHYIEKFKNELRERRSTIVALKSAQAYQRNIHFEKTSYSSAKRVFGKHPSEASAEERDMFGNYIFHVALEMAVELDLPVQIHTGLGKLQGSNPLLLENVISTYPDVRFVLFHGGFPWIYEISALAHNYGNVILDINWLPLISTTAAKQALHSYIETLRDNRRITWGTDTWTSEEAIGATLAVKHVLTEVLSEKVENGYFSINEAEKLAHKIMYENALRIYKKM